jgi:hypothetical protein
MIAVVPVEKKAKGFTASSVVSHDAIVEFPSLEGYVSQLAEVEWQGIRTTLAVFSRGDSHWVKWEDLGRDS